MFDVRRPYASPALSIGFFIGGGGGGFFAREGGGGGGAFFCTAAPFNVVELLLLVTPPNDDTGESDRPWYILSGLVPDRGLVSSDGSAAIRARTLFLPVMKFSLGARYGRGLGLYTCSCRSCAGLSNVEVLLRKGLCGKGSGAKTSLESPTSDGDLLDRIIGRRSAELVSSSCRGSYRS